MALDYSRYPEIRNNVIRLIDRNLKKIPDIFDKDKSEMAASTCSSLTRSYYSLANLNYLLDGDINGFYTKMYRAAKSFQYILERHYANPKDPIIDWSYINATDVRAIIVSMAINDFELAQYLSKLQTKEYAAAHDPDDFYLFTMGIRKLLEGELADFEKLLKNFDKVRGGERKGASEVLKALYNRKQEEFDEGIVNYQNEWKQSVMDGSFADIAPGALKGDEQICLIGFALVRLGEKLGLKLKEEYEMIPKELLGYQNFVPPTDGFPISKS